MNIIESTRAIHGISTTGTYRSLLTAIGACLISFFVTFVFLGSSASAATPSSLSTGSAHACAVVDGMAKCWGNNASGQLGNDSNKNALAPAPVYTKAAWTETQKGKGECIERWLGICTKQADKVINHPNSPLYGKTVTKVSAGQYHTCAIAGARAYCWGNGGNGRLGNNSTSDSSRPEAVVTSGALRGKELVDITAGDNFTCALATDGTVACWGENGNGQLGTGNRKDKSVPVAVSTVSGSALQNNKVRKLAVLKGEANTMCVITREDKAVCWGENYAGQVGNGKHAEGTDRCIGTGGGTRLIIDVQDKSTKQDSLVPVLAIEGAVKSITVSGKAEKTSDINGFDIGYSYVTALKDDGKAYWSGGSTSARQCGSGSNTNAQGQNCHQSGGAGQGGCSGPSYERTYTYQGHCIEEKVVLFGGKCVKRSSPGPISGPLYANADAGALKDQAIAFTSGSLLTGSNLDQYPVCTKINGLFSWTDSTSCPDLMPSGTACAVLANNRSAVYCDDEAKTCTDNSNGTPEDIAWLKNQKLYVRNCVDGPGPVASGGASWLKSDMAILSIDTGSSYSCAVASNNTIGCWGEGSKGQLGNGIGKDSAVPVRVSGI